MSNVRPMRRKAPEGFYIEVTGNIIVHHPVKQAEVIPFLGAEIAKSALRFTQRGEAITFYREVEERRAA